MDACQDTVTLGEYITVVNPPPEVSANLVPVPASEKQVTAKRIYRGTQRRVLSINNPAINILKQLSRHRSTGSDRNPALVGFRAILNLY